MIECPRPLEPQCLRLDHLGDASACHDGVGLHRRSISRSMHLGTVGGVQRYVAHAHDDFAVARLGHRAFDEAEMLESELARRLLDQQDLPIDTLFHDKPLAVVSRRPLHRNCWRGIGPRTRALGAALDFNILC
jgi:hypothetical protein